MITTLINHSVAPLSNVATVPANCSSSFFTLEPWYQYLSVDPKTCDVTNFNSTNILGGSSPFLLIGLAILDDLIKIAALVAVGFVVYGGIQYVTSQGAPDATKKAQQTIINALVGVVLSIVAASIVSFIGNQLGKS